MTDLEGLLSRVNSTVALREFTFNENRFWPVPAESREFADGAMWLKKKLVVFQVKEREEGSDHSSEAIQLWFEGTVRRIGSRQIRKTHSYLQEHDKIVITNARGHQFNVNTGDFESIVNVVLFGSTSGLPANWANPKHHVSRSTGRELFIHFISIDDYVRLCDALLTPMEIFEYLQFREQYLTKVSSGTGRTEKWILGRFLMSPDIENDKLDQSAIDCSSAVDNLDDNTEFLKVRRFLEEMGDRIAYQKRLGVRRTSQRDTETTGYYEILIAFALLNRVGLMAFDERLKQAVRFANKDELLLSRFEDPKQGFG